MSEKVPEQRVCELLDAIEKLLSENTGRIPAASFALFHVRRSKEIIGCKKHMSSGSTGGSGEESVVVE